jgi:hypothetical protein
LEDPTLDSDQFYNAYTDRENANWDKMYENYDAAVDWPTVAFYKDLLIKYPDAKVILTVRSADSWYESAKNTIHQSALFAETLPKDHPLYSFGRMCNRVTFGGELADPEKFKNKEYIKRLFLDHIKDVKRTVPPDQLFVKELGSGWDGLCEFLGKDLPKEPYPRGNSTQDFKKALADLSEDLEKNYDASGDGIAASN